MALLTKATRKEWMKLLGYEYNKAGIYGQNTDKLLRHLHHVKVYTKNFKPEEFRCPCGHCTGYPTWMKVHQLKHVQAIRDRYDRPMTITSGLRCEYENSRLTGSSKESAHLKGRAVDFYMPLVTDSLDHRRSSVAYIKRLKYHDYTYGNGISSTGAFVVAPNMGNALHTQTK